MSTPDEDVISQLIGDKLAANPDLTVQTHESPGQRVTRFSPKELIEARGLADTQSQRRTFGIFRRVRMNKAGK